MSIFWGSWNIFQYFHPSWSWSNLLNLLVINVYGKLCNWISSSRLAFSLSSYSTQMVPYYQYLLQLLDNNYIFMPYILDHFFKLLPLALTVTFLCGATWFVITLNRFLIHLSRFTSSFVFMEQDPESTAFVQPIFNGEVYSPVTHSPQRGPLYLVCVYWVSSIILRNTETNMSCFYRSLEHSRVAESRILSLFFFSLL